MTSQLPFPEAEPDDEAWDFEQWVIDNRAEHVEELFARLMQGTLDPEREAQRKACMHNWLVKVPSGRIGNTSICWVCYGDRCYTSPKHPIAFNVGNILEAPLDLGPFPSTLRRCIGNVLIE